MKSDLNNSSHLEYQVSCWFLSPFHFLPYSFGSLLFTAEVDANVPGAHTKNDQYLFRSKVAKTAADSWKTIICDLQGWHLCIYTLSGSLGHYPPGADCSYIRGLLWRWSSLCYISFLWNWGLTRASCAHLELRAVRHFLCPCMSDLLHPHKTRTVPLLVTKGGGAFELAAVECSSVLADAFKKQPKTYLFKMAFGSLVWYFSLWRSSLFCGRCYPE